MLQKKNLLLIFREITKIVHRKVQQAKAMYLFLYFYVAPQSWKPFMSSHLSPCFLFPISCSLLCDLPPLTPMFCMQVSLLFLNYQELADNWRGPALVRGRVWISGLGQGGQPENSFRRATFDGKCRLLSFQSSLLSLTTVAGTELQR